MSDQIITATLDNGLQVFLKEIHTAPIISHWVWYRVGSRNETAGKTGISHWVEHMQFKGTPKYPAGVLDQAVSRDGGVWNAFTYLDWTAFFATMPKEKIDLSIDLEADRMQNSLFLPEEVESERTVILSEREGSENEPMFRLNEATDRAAFDHHPYGIEVIGEKKDLLSISRDDLYEHYCNYYSPANAVLTMAGDFEAKEMLERLQKRYQEVPERAVKRIPVTPEAPLKEERRVTVEGPGETVYLRLVWRAPAGSAADIFPLAVLDSILTGPSSLNMFGSGSISNKTSRLYQPLIEDQVAIAFNGSYNTTIDPYLYAITVIMHPAHQPEEAVALIDRQLDQIRSGKISLQEMEKAVKQARALFAYGTENITNQAYWLGYTEMFDKYAWFSEFVPSLKKVSVEDVARVAAQYLRPDQRVIGMYKPYLSKGGSA
mgnify:CR=1 FL=1